jgi:hypothetical protein
MHKTVKGQRWLLTPSEDGWTSFEAEEVARLLQEEGISARRVGAPGQDDSRYCPVEVGDGQQAMKAKLLLDDVGIVVSLTGVRDQKN